MRIFKKNPDSTAHNVEGDQGRAKKEGERKLNSKSEE